MKFANSRLALNPRPANLISSQHFSHFWWPQPLFSNSPFALSTSGGLQAFRGFLRSEFSEENLKFWLACEDYRGSPSKTKASSIYGQFINPDAPQEVSARVRRERHRAWSSSVWSKPAAPPLPQVNLDAETREALLKAMDSVGADRFNEAQQRIYSLMAKDSFPRFLRSSQRTEAITAFWACSVRPCWVCLPCEDCIVPFVPKASLWSSSFILCCHCLQP